MNKATDSWVFDSLVAFLNGPIWNAPLQSFIEEKSIIFEPNNVQQSDEYMKIFEEFKNLVDFMLNNFMEDLEINPEQLENACDEGKRFIAFDNTLFEHIWAANDSNLFIRMMTQRNVELQLQALELIEKKYGIMPESFIPKKPDHHQESSSSREIKLENEILEEAAKKFTEHEASSSSASGHEEIQHILEEKPILEQQLENLTKNSTSNNNNNNNNEKVSSHHQLLLKIDPLELKMRQKYLKSQRDKLVALKKEARKNQLQKSDSLLLIRPKSAKAANAILTDDVDDDDGATEINNKSENQLQLRKNLAARLRAEVVNK